VLFCVVEARRSDSQMIIQIRMRTKGPGSKPVQHTRIAMTGLGGYVGTRERSVSTS
jgi:hypothetical protein